MSKLNEIMKLLSLGFIGTYPIMAQVEQETTHEIKPNTGSYSGSLYDLAYTPIDPKKHLNNIISKRKTKRK